jgi:ABC-type polysaccharide/polyol phosphate export permease
MIYYGVAPGPSIVMLPLVVLIQIIFTTSIALLLAMWNLFYRDIKYLFEVFVSVWMFGSAVMYPASAIDGRMGLAIQLNPMTTIIEAYRSTILYGEWPPMAPLAWMAFFSTVLLGVAWLQFHRSEFKFAENV